MQEQLFAFLLWPWTLTYNPNLRRWPGKDQVEASCQISRSTVIQFKNYCPVTQTRTCTWPIALREIQFMYWIHWMKMTFFVWTTNQLRAETSSVSSVSVAGVDLSAAEEIKVLGVVLDRRLTFHKHVSAMAWWCNNYCNYHAQAIRHTWHLLNK